MEKRIFKALYIFFLLAFSLLIFRYFQVQILLDDKIFKETLLKYFPDVVIQRIPDWRGTIYTADGIPLAIPVKRYVFYAITSNLSEEEKKFFAEHFSDIFNIGPKWLLKILNSRNGYVEIYKTSDYGVYEAFLKRKKELIKGVKRITRSVLGRGSINENLIKEYYKSNKNLNLLKALQILNLLKWVGVDTYYGRYYPQRNFLANTVGFVNKEGHGKGGIELLEDKDLYKGPIEIHLIKGTKEFKLTEEPLFKKIQKGFVSDVYLTVDYTIQAILERTKKEIVERWNPKKVVIMLMDIHTGAVKGLAVYPDFDPNRPFRNWQEFLNSKNPAFMDVFEMGSVIKPFFVGLALYKKRISPDDKIFIDGGKTKIGGHTVSDAEHLPKKYLTPREVLIHSSNVGTVQIARHLTKEDEEELIKLLKWKEIISDFPGSTAGIVPDLNLPANRLYIAFGQGLALTPAHLVSSYAALITGYAPKPQLIAKVVREDGKVLKVFKPQYLNDKPLFDKKTRQWLKETMHLIVLEGTGKKANPYYYKVGGKTGTAQVYDKKLHRYSSTRYVTSFIGYFPYENPKFILLVLVDEPKAPRRYLLYGGTVAAPYWREIVNQVSAYLGITPDGNLEPAKE
jgi:cell division protein FtsI (penicillin-binding protein 3)